MNDSSEKNFWLCAENRIQTLLNRFVGLLDTETVESVQHYLDHSEYELAFEGLFIELMKVDAVLEKDESEIYLKLAMELGLDRDSVFDGKFWEKFKAFMDVD
ncbi:MAG: MafI family immunity protein [Pseudomonadota bacterium]|nr:MafI family immunity protein [Pseudomonadota bacterium]